MFIVKNVIQALLMFVGIKVNTMEIKTTQDLAKQLNSDYTQFQFDYSFDEDMIIATINKKLYYVWYSEIQNKFFFRNQQTQNLDIVNNYHQLTKLFFDT